VESGATSGEVIGGTHRIGELTDAKSLSHAALHAPVESTDDGELSRCAESRVASRNPASRSAASR
jgi:hypothetical protein